MFQKFKWTYKRNPSTRHPRGPGVQLPRRPPPVGLRGSVERGRVRGEPGQDDRVPRGNEHTEEEEKAVGKAEKELLFFDVYFGI